MEWKFIWLVLVWPGGRFGKWWFSVKCHWHWRPVWETQGRLCKSGCSQGLSRSLWLEETKQGGPALTFRAMGPMRQSGLNEVWWLWKFLLLVLSGFWSWSPHPQEWRRLRVGHTPKRRQSFHYLGSAAQSRRGCPAMVMTTLLNALLILSAWQCLTFVPVVAYVPRTHRQGSSDFTGPPPVGSISWPAGSTRWKTTFVSQAPGKGSYSRCLWDINRRDKHQNLLFWRLIVARLWGLRDRAENSVHI